MKLLVIRFSAFGDVAMTVPVIATVASQHPDWQITVLSRRGMQSLYDYLPANVTFHGVNLDEYKGLSGLMRLFKELKAMRFDAVADLHHVLRSQVLRTLFAFSGVKTAHINKGRAEKRALTRTRKKQLRQLPTSFARYAAVFEKLGLKSDDSFRSIYGTGRGDTALFQSAVELKPGKRHIGFAPFAAHRGKMLPEATSLQIIKLLAQRNDCQVLLFGGGKTEVEKLTRWTELCRAEGLDDHITLVAGKLKLNGELALMSHLDVMISMDSANMHLASLTATPVVSVWGATHPYAGFMGWKQQDGRAVQTNLPCRPCSIFGNKPCQRGDYACLQQIQAEDVVKAVLS